MKQNLCKILFFLIVFFVHGYIKSSNYYLISVGTQRVLSLVNWPAIPSVNKPSEWQGSHLVINKSLYKDYILPFEKYLGLKQQPILIYEKNFPKQNGFTHFSNDPNIPHLIVVPFPAKKNIPTILHEITHIYLYHKKKLIPKSYFSQLRYFMPIGIKSILLQQLKEPFFNFISLGYFALGLYSLVVHETKKNQIEEMICDSYVSLAFENPKKTISLIDQDINYFEKDFNNNTNTFLTDYLYGETHPSNAKRINHLKKIKGLISKNQPEKIKKWIEKQEDYLLNNLSPMYAIFGIPNLT